jgi:hypothetical protein
MHTKDSYELLVGSRQKQTGHPALKKMVLITGSALLIATALFIFRIPTFVQAATTPKIISAYPVNQEKNVAVNPQFSFTFDTDMNSDSFNIDSVYLINRSQGAEVALNMTYNTSTRQLIVSSKTTLAADAEYQLYLTSRIRDTAGGAFAGQSFTFFTSNKSTAGGSESFNLQSRYPQPGEKDVPVRAEVKLVFTKAMNKNSVNIDNFYLTLPGGKRVAASVSYDSATHTAVLTPDDLLNPGSEYTVFLDEGLRDATGAEAGGIFWRFTTKATTTTETSTVSPGNATVFIIQMNPAGNATDVPIDSVIEFTFSDGMEPASVNNESITLTKQGSVIPLATIVSYSSSQFKVRMQPVAKLEKNTEYTVTISDSVRDSGGKSFRWMQWRFTTDAGTASSGTTTTSGGSTQKGTMNYPLVSFNNQIVKFSDASPYIKNKRTMVPMRGVFELVGAQMTWDNDRQKITAISGGNMVELYIGKSTAYRNGKPITLEAPPEISKNRTMVPLRFAVESLGLKVGWDADNYIVKLNK